MDRVPQTMIGSCVVLRRACPLQRLHACNQVARRQGRLPEVVVHRSDCRDAKKDARKAQQRHGNDWDATGTSVDAVVAQEVAEFQGQGQNFQESDSWKFCPCCRK